MYSFFKQSARLACAALLTTSLSAEDKSVYELDEYLVSAGPLLRSVGDFANPFSVLNTDALRRESTASLGQALDGQPGVSASSFAAGASRPVIRGFDGPRVRILESGIESIDASAVSPDHGLAIEPLLVERVEILRGPATLLYGGSAIGGAVNVIDREIPRSPGTRRVEGAVETRYDSASEGETLVGHASYGDENWAIAATGLHREHKNYEIPNEADQGSELENSFFESEQYSIGGSWFFTPQNRIGLAYSEYESQYGIPGEEATIDLERERLSGEIALSEPFESIAAIRLRGSYNDYTHTEFEGDGEVGTVFDREGWNLRFEAAHEPVGPITEGLAGMEWTDFDLSADGEESFIPPSDTETLAFFLNERLTFGNLQVELGGRIEQQDINAGPLRSGIDGNYDEVATSAALSFIWALDEQQSLTLTLSRSERHPDAAELFADGPHLAIDRFELGDPNLDKETAYSIDLGYRHQTETWTTHLNVFYTEFDDFIFLQDLGFETDAEGRPDSAPGFDPSEAFETAQRTGTDARFYGAEAEIEWAFYQTKNSSWRAALLGDYVRATDEDNRDNLPRIPPVRLAARLTFESGPWDGKLLLRRALQQESTASNETSTSGYTELNAHINRSFDIGNGQQLNLFARADNLLDEEIRHHTSFLKDLAPLPGRSLTIGARYEF